ncbi:hypothetical protein WA026_015920 [Henosepilachna vigintioctopunctata]|uniref:Uncharacterized protein n=1 Tax=Henosepilachna vigintioctopunctata TaxID=420089 RepID=A0AAW1UC85_9CUCU
MPVLLINLIADMQHEVHPTYICICSFCLGLWSRRGEEYRQKACGGGNTWHPMALLRQSLLPSLLPHLLKRDTSAHSIHKREAVEENKPKSQEKRDLVLGYGAYPYYSSYPYFTGYPYFNYYNSYGLFY